MNARIKKIDTERLEAELDRKRIVIVTGFQGVDRNQNITTLGRGGSDTSAVALAAALEADLCQIYTDVDGVYTADPRYVKGAKKLDEVTYNEMLECKIGSIIQLYRSFGYKSERGGKTHGKDSSQQRSKG